MRRHILVRHTPLFLFYGDESDYTGGVFGLGQPVLVVAGILLNTYGGLEDPTGVP